MTAPRARRRVTRPEFADPLDNMEMAMPTLVSVAPAPAPLSPILEPALLLETARQTREIYGSALGAWTQESVAILGEFLREDSAALQQFYTSATPMAALAVGQAWWMARTRSYMDCGLRLFEACLPKGAASPADVPTVFHLPE